MRLPFHSVSVKYKKDSFSLISMESQPYKDMTFSVVRAQTRRLQCDLPPSRRSHRSCKAGPVPNRRILPSANRRSHSTPTKADSIPPSHSLFLRTTNFVKSSADFCAAGVFLLREVKGGDDNDGGDGRRPVYSLPLLLSAPILRLPSVSF